MSANTSKLSLLSQQELDDRLAEISVRILGLQLEQQRLIKEMRCRSLKCTLEADDYLITTEKFEINDNDDDDSEIISSFISLPVWLSLRTIGRPQDNEENAEIKYYDDDKMPDWCRYLNHPEADTSTWFESRGEWDTSGWDSPYSARGRCYFSIYGLRVKAENRPQSCIFFNYEDEDYLALYKLEDGHYRIYIQDEAGDTEHSGIKFKFSETLELEEFDFDSIILLPNIGRNSKASE